MDKLKNIAYNKFSKVPNKNNNILTNNNEIK